MTFLLEFMQKISYKKVIKYLQYSSYFPINKLCILVWKNKHVTEERTNEVCIQCT